MSPRVGCHQRCVGIRAVGSVTNPEPGFRSDCVGSSDPMGWVVGFMHLGILYDIFNEYVKNGQRRLCQEFDYRRNMLKFDSNDHYLIRKFYDLQPNNEQVRDNERNISTSN